MEVLSTAGSARSRGTAQSPLLAAAQHLPSHRGAPLGRSHWSTSGSPRQRTRCLSAPEDTRCLLSDSAMEKSAGETGKLHPSATAFIPLLVSDRQRELVPHQKGADNSPRCQPARSSLHFPSPKGNQLQPRAADGHHLQPQLRSSHSQPYLCQTQMFP